LGRQKHHLPCNNDPIQTKLNQNSDEGCTDLPPCKSSISEDNSIKRNAGIF
jgi:hypothetical protein